MLKKPTIGVVGLGEAGNFGDDLIIIAVVQSIKASAETAHIRFTSFGHHLDWEDLSAHLGMPLNPVRARSGRDFPGSLRNSRLLDCCDAVVFGGGGLLQTSHHPERPYHWINYIPSSKPLAPTLAVGLGIGPLSSRWERRLAALGSPFNESYLRDPYSVHYAEERLGWRSRRCRDFIDGPFLKQFAVNGESGIARLDGPLGVAIRAWPGLEADKLAAHIDRIAERENVSSIRFFILEAPSGCGPDLPFTEKVRALVRSRPTSQRTYLGAELVDFLSDLESCSAAISMKLHSSAVWSAANVKIYPIFYAPKTASFFGQEYRGLEVRDDVVAPVGDEPSVIRAQDVIADWIEEIAQPDCDRSRAVFSRHQKLRFQATSLGWNLRRRVNSVFAAID